MISLRYAHEQVGRLEPLPPVPCALKLCLGAVCSEDIHAIVDCPSMDSSLKDGFAVVSSDVAMASEESPVSLCVAGSVCAGDDFFNEYLKPGHVVRLMTGAAIPKGATAVLASEFCREQWNSISALADAQPDRNILHQGSDISMGQRIVQKGEVLSAAHLGLIAAAGVNTVSCYLKPRVVIAATGSELVLPGEYVEPGKVAASNMVTAAAELSSLGLHVQTVVLRDNLDNLQARFQRIIRQAEVLITCGGILDGDKDFTLQALEAIGMEIIFHRVRIGPGKGACMGRVGQTVVFNLPGGPPSNHVALQLLALPGVRRLMGHSDFLPVQRKATVSEELHGQSDWTQLVYAQVQFKNDRLQAFPVRGRDRLGILARANGLICLPEGSAKIEKNALATIWMYREIL